MADLRLPPHFEPLLRSHGVRSLFPPQEDALRAGLLEGGNFLLTMPTASGKTLLAEMAMADTLARREGRCLYVVPLVALAYEKQREFGKSGVLG
ncbi:MAG: DEAD/DEAH box helicase, partial [Euryarchaeota archaeon]|nr:DEAD/DEAH box helicase [Euryarchaeota archaeon]